MSILVTLVAVFLLGAVGTGAPTAGTATAPMVNQEGSQVTVERIAGGDRFATAANVASDKFRNVDRVFLATGENFADALTAGAVAGAQQAPLLLAGGQTLPNATRDALTALSPDEVVVVGGRSAIDEQVAAQAAAAADAELRRVAGRHRIDTAAQLIDEFGGRGDAVYVATAEGFADALAGSAVAALEEAPLLLTGSGTLADETAYVIEQLDPQRIEILGGSAAISHEVESELAALGDAAVTRHGGSDRFDTAAQVVQSRVEYGGRIYLATGEDYPDALSGAAAAASEAAPLLLTGTNQLPDPAAEALREFSPWMVTVLGGDSAVSESVVQSVAKSASGQDGHLDHCDGPPAQRHPDCQDAGGDSDAEPDRVLSGEVTLEGFTVPEGEVWAFDPDADTTVETTKNVIVQGNLRMKPSTADVTHTLRFTGIDESAFEGGHVLDPLDSDVGLWVVGEGRLDLQGTERQGWNRTGNHASWLDGDEVRQAPIEPGATDQFREFGPGGEVPSVTAPDGSEHHAEVFNLTRNVRIHGGGSNPPEMLNDDGRTHVFIRSSKPQVIRHVELRYVGPREPHDRDGTTGRDGRYGLHFHHNHEGSRGTIIEGVVIRDSGSHNFVPHLSHGITFRDTVVFDTFGNGYWWDPEDETHDVLYDHAAVFMQHAHPSTRGYSLHGFTLGEGRNMTVRDSVVVGNHGSQVNAGAFMWPDFAKQPDNKWEFVGNVAHNNRDAGIAVWQNRSTGHVIEDFVAFHNGRGISHGAYLNQYAYAGLLLFANEHDIEQHALATSEPLTFEGDVETIHVRRHVLSGSTPTVYQNVQVRGGVTIDEEDQEPGNIEFRYDCDHQDVLLTEEDFVLISVVSDLKIVDECTDETTVLHDSGRGL